MMNQNTILIADWRGNDIFITVNNEPSLAVLGVGDSFRWIDEAHECAFEISIHPKDEREFPIDRVLDWMSLNGLGRDREKALALMRSLR